jgi:hypothetical protein
MVPMNVTSMCPECGLGLGSSDKFCGRCGAAIERCATCGAAALSSDRFCGACGQEFRAEVVSGGLTPSDRTYRSPWDDVVNRLTEATAGEYEIIRELGRGGMAAVFLAHEVALNRKVAIKVMSPGIMSDTGMIERFQGSSRKPSPSRTCRTRTSSACMPSARSTICTSSS